MNDTTIITPEFEIVPAEAGLDLASKNSLEIAFSGFFTEAAKWKEQAASITDPKLARTARLELKNLRVSAEKKRKELKEDSLRMGKAIDGANNILLALIVPIEKSLEEVEKAEERRKAAELAKLIEDRQEALRPFLDLSMPLPSNLGQLTPEQFEKMLADSKFLHEARIEAARKAEEERLAKERAEAEERERIRLENERLKKEAEEREAAAKLEREAAEKARLEAEAKAKAEREKLEAEKKAAEEKARKEREAIEAKARKEREAAEAQAKKEREAREKAEAEAKALRDAEEQRKKDEAEAKAKAEAAPDKEKLMTFAQYVRARMNPGQMTSEKGRATAEEIAAKVEQFAAWIEKKAQAI